MVSDPKRRIRRGHAFYVPSSVEQPAETFSSIAAVNRWLTVQGAACNTPDFEQLRAAVLVLTKTQKPRQEDVRPLCVSWNVRRKHKGQDRPLPTLITELQQAVITEGCRLRASFVGQAGAPASSAEQPAVAGCTGKRPLDSASAAQPGIPAPPS